MLREIHWARGPRRAGRGVGPSVGVACFWCYRSVGLKGNQREKPFWGCPLETDTPEHCGFACLFVCCLFVFPFQRTYPSPPTPRKVARRCFSALWHLPFLSAPQQPRDVEAWGTSTMKKYFCFGGEGKAVRLPQAKAFLWGTG